MAGGSSGYHEPFELLSQETTEMHRAIVSAQEELEAVDWYRQRADACRDDELRAVLVHNMNEEIEHFCMTLEWMRRHDAQFDEQLRTYLFAEAGILDAEASASGAAPASDGSDERDGGGLTVGSLRE